MCQEKTPSSAKQCTVLCTYLWSLYVSSSSWVHKLHATSLINLWVLKSAVLATTNLTNDHTVENFAEELKRITDEWNIMNKVDTLVTDNAANAVAAVWLNGWKDISCFAHTLNLVMQDSLAADPIWSGIQKNLNLDKHKLVQDVQSCWNSTSEVSCVLVMMKSLSKQ